ncbi:13078_t:CDS:1 [Acaulospora morrowiae]|uniref:13078_t:CDS:1 n=1 Tax=Acaulospora morrowiae TaxID=94023 RepID=A0A9N9B539_9GLOM|nr:13078_t:CDS:1 [Acaulospora morrowiae]
MTRSPLFSLPRALYLLIARFQSRNVISFFSGRKLHSFRRGLSTNNAQHQKSQTREEKELYLRLTKSFREKLVLKPQKPENLYGKVIETSILDTLKVLRGSNSGESEKLMVDVNSSNHGRLTKSELVKLVNKIKASTILNDVQQLKNIHEDMKHLNITDINIYNRILQGFILCKDIEFASRVYEEIRNKDLLPNIRTLTTLLNATMGTPSAHEYFQEIQTLKLKLSSIFDVNTILRYHITRNDNDSVQRLWQELVNQTPNIQATLINDKGERLKPNSFSYSLYTGFLCKNGMFDVAIETLRTMEHGVQPNSVNFLRHVIQPLAQNNHPTEAWRYLSDIRRKTVHPRNIYSKYYTFIIEAFVQRNDLNSAGRVFADMEEIGVDLDPRAKEIYVCIREALNVINEDPEDEAILNEYKII